MSRVLFQQIKYCGKSLPGKNILTSKIRNLSSSKNDKNGNKKNSSFTSLSSQSLGQTTILVQEGSDIQELPVIIRKLKKDEFTTILADRYDKDFDENQNFQQNINQLKEEEILDLLKEFHKTKDILNVIDKLTETELSPQIAYIVLNQLLKTETLINLRNLQDNSSVFNKLIDCLLKNGDHKLLIELLDVLKEFPDLQKTIQSFCNELLLRNSDGILNIIEICECIETFLDCQQNESVEKLWIGLSNNEKNINDKNIKFIYKMLPKLKISRRLVIGILERRIGTVWWNLKQQTVFEILLSLQESNLTPFRTMESLGRWLNTNIHAIDELHLGMIINLFTKLDFTNEQIEKALERYIKAKSVRVKSTVLIERILKHCSKFRLRNFHILNGSSEYFLMKSDEVSEEFIKTILITFGLLDYQPLNSIRFWQTIENYLKTNFSVMNPENLIQIFLNCCYLEMYPLNFVSSIFNPYFLDLLHTKSTEMNLMKQRNDLKLLDTCLTLECENYDGPLLPRDHSAKTIWQDGRIKRLANNLNDFIEEIAGGHKNFTKSVIIGKLPINSLYIIDILIHPPDLSNYWSYSIRNDRNTFIAILIHIPEYYNSTGEYLIGPQIMRIRHMRRLGLKVVTLNYDKVAKLLLYPKQLTTYLIESMKKALPALPK